MIIGEFIGKDKTLQRVQALTMGTQSNESTVDMETGLNSRLKISNKTSSGRRRSATQVVEMGQRLFSDTQ